MIESIQLAMGSHPEAIGFTDQSTVVSTRRGLRVSLYNRAACFQN